jgi:hypothetical protein
MLEQDIENMLSNFNTIGDFISSSSVSEPGHLSVLVDIIFENVLEEPDTAKLYAQLCFALKDMLPEFNDEVPPHTVPPADWRAGAEHIPEGLYRR